MRHWVVATCCYAPGLVMIAEQWRRAARRNVKKATNVHIDEFTKTTDKRNDKQPLARIWPGLEPGSWPKLDLDLAMANGQWPWPIAMVNAQWPMRMANSHGQ